MHNFLVVIFVNILLLEQFASCCYSCMLCLYEVLHLYGFMIVYLKHAFLLPRFFAPLLQCGDFELCISIIRNLDYQKCNNMGNITNGRVE